MIKNLVILLLYFSCYCQVEHLCLCKLHFFFFTLPFDFVFPIFLCKICFAYYSVEAFCIIGIEVFVNHEFFGGFFFFLEYSFFLDLLYGILWQAEFFLFYYFKRLIIFFVASGFPLLLKNFHTLRFYK